MTSSGIMVITGTRKGIGRYLAEYYLEKGFTVIGCSRSDSEFSHPNYEHYSLDVAHEAKVKEMFSGIRSAHKQVDILINNAGVASMNHCLLTPLRSVRKILETNVVGTFLFCREAAKLMRKSKNGRIVNFSTVATPLRLEGEAMYAASKAAIVSLTQILARELSEYGITVNAVGPTPVETDLIRSVPKDKMTRLIHMQAIPRFGTFEDIVNVIDFFIKAESSFITGQNIYLGGV